MSMFFQLLDVTTGNLVTEFQSEDEAIAALSAVQVEEGDEPILDFALFRFDNGHPSLVAKRGELARYIARARRRFADRVSPEAQAKPRAPSSNAGTAKVARKHSL
jgi:hypothetical protein